MQTPNILNTISTQSNPALASKSSNSPPPEAPFNQVLSREVQNRQDNKETNKAAPKEREKNNTEKASSPPAQTASKKDGDTTADNKVKDDTNPETSDAAAAAAAVPIDLLALVSNINALTEPRAVAGDDEKKLAPGDPTISGLTKKSSKVTAGEVATAKSDKPVVQDSTAKLTAFATTITGAKEAIATNAKPDALAANAKPDALSAGAKPDALAAGAKPDALAANARPDTLTDLSKQTTSQDVSPNVTTTVATKEEPKNGAELTVSSKKPEALADLVSTVKGKEVPTETSSIARIKEILPVQSAPVTAPVMQASLNLAQAVTAQPTERLSPPVGSPAWDQALGQKVVWMVAGGLQSASMTLNPPDLGPLQVVVSVNNDQANATFTAAQPEVRQALEAAMPRLREMMSEAGIQLGSATVGTGLPNQQNGSEQQARQSQSQSNSRFDMSGGSLDVPLRPVGISTTIQNQGMVDTFA